MITEQKTFKTDDLVVFMANDAIGRIIYRIQIVADTVLCKAGRSDFEVWLTVEEFRDKKPVKVGWSEKKWWGLRIDRLYANSKSQNT